MCGTCGCTDEGYRIDGHPHPGHDHAHSGAEDGHGKAEDGHGKAEDGHGKAEDGHGKAGDGHGKEAAGPGGRTVLIQEKVLARNDALAQRNRAWLAQREVLAVNVMSSPGSGKTTLLERTARDLAGELAISVIEGDQETALDASRIRAAGCQVVQINTGTGCHLDAAMVAGALRALDPPPGSLLVIENVGNLVCPALFDLGEAARVVLASVPEGADKPAKYPAMFRRADLVLITKTDLLPYLAFDLDRCTEGVRQASPRAQILQLSATAGAGLPGWYGWLRDRLSPVRRRRDHGLA